MHDYDEKDDPDDGIGQGGSGVGPMPTKIDIKMEDMLTRPDSQVEAEHDVIPMLKVRPGTCQLADVFHSMVISDNDRSI